MPKHGNARDVAHDVSHDALQILIKTSRWPNRDLALTLRSMPGPSGQCQGLGLGLGLVCRVQWVVWFACVGGFGFGLGLGFGVARVLLVGQTVPDQSMLVPPDLPPPSR